MLASGWRLFPRLRPYGVRCVASSVTAIAPKNDASAVSSMTREQLKRFQTSDNDSQTAKWFLRMASAHAADFEFRCLPTNSIVQFVMRRRSPEESTADPSPHDAVWVPVALQCCSGPRGPYKRFWFRSGTSPWSMTPSTCGVLAACFPLQLLWCLTAPSEPPRTIRRGDRFESFLIEGEEGMLSLSARLDAMWQHPDIRRETWADWIELSNRAGRYVASRKLMRQAVSLAPLHDLRFALERFESYNAILAGRTSAPSELSRRIQFLLALRYRSPQCRRKRGDCPSNS